MVKYLLIASLMTVLVGCDKKEAEAKKAFNTASGMPNQTNLPGATDEEIYNRLHNK